jgi:putative nucleotidyltransferase with HDIG domain
LNKELRNFRNRIRSEYQRLETELFFHNWEHTQTVRHFAMQLGRKLGADKVLVELAALVHDIGYLLDSASAHHEDDSVKFARELATKPEYRFLQKYIDKLEACVLSTRMQADSGPLLEAQITKDADLIQFALENYPRKVFELHFELTKAKKITDLSLRDFVRNTPHAMTLWVPYDPETGVVGYVTPVAKKLASEGFRKLYELYTRLSSIAEHMTEVEFENLYIKFLMQLEKAGRSRHNKVVSDTFHETLLERIFYREEVRRTKKEKKILEVAEEKINQGVSENEVIEYILKAIVEAVDAQAATLFALDENNQIHFLNTHYSPQVFFDPEMKSRLLSMAPLAPGQGIVGTVIQTHKPRMVRDVATEKDFFPEPSEKTGFRVKTMICVPLMVYDKAIGAIQVLNKNSIEKIIPFSNRDLQLAEEVARVAAASLNRARLFDSIIQTLIDLIDAKDKYTRSHTEHVKALSIEMVKAMGLHDTDIKRVEYAAAIHDIGKIATPGEILNKNGSLTDEEWVIMKQHAHLPEKITRVHFPPFLADVPRLAAMHHERVDGKGYPSGLSGTDLPLIPRILAVADTFDAMTSDRPYRSAMSLEEAISVLESVKGTQLDPKIVELFIREKIYEKAASPE